MHIEIKEFLNSHTAKQIGTKFHFKPREYLIDNGFEEYTFLIGEDYEETRRNIYRFLHGEGYCEICNGIVNRLMVGFSRGWFKTCSPMCTGILRSEKMKGKKNPVYSFSEEQRNEIKAKQSKALRKRILRGEFTPQTNNYKNSRVINFILNDKKYVVRSLWELIYMVKNPDLEYETLRLPYFDTSQNKERVYIVDFFDKASNTIIEVKPKAYQHTLADKIKGVKDLGYNFKIIDEDYFNQFRNIETRDLILKEVFFENIIEDNILSRMKWFGFSEVNVKELINEN